jgi:hypothetical protein
VAKIVPNKWISSDRPYIKNKEYFIFISNDLQKEASFESSEYKEKFQENGEYVYKGYVLYTGTYGFCLQKNAKRVSRVPSKLKESKGFSEAELKKLKNKKSEKKENLKKVKMNASLKNSEYLKSSFLSK